MNPIRLILAAPFFGLTMVMLMLSVVVDLIGAAAMMACIVVGGME